MKVIKYKFKRGIKLPKRIIVTGLLLLVQIASIILLTMHISSSFYWAYALFSLLSIVCVMFIVNERNNQSYKITWIIFILGIPFAGWLFFLVYGGNRVFPYLKRRYLRIEKETGEYIIQNPDVMKSIKKNGLIALRQARYLLSESGYPVYKNTKTTFYPSGEKVFEAVLSSLKSAKKFIFIEFFIIAEGYMWEKIFEILKERASKGVEVLVLFDDFGSASRQYRDFVDRLELSGIKTSVFNPIKPTPYNIFLNNRNHRKIIVVDNKQAFTGGFNIADEYINRIERFGHWLDCGIKLEGEAVKSFTVMFINMWRFTEFKTTINIDKYLETSHLENEAVGFVQPYCDGPFDDKYAAEGIYLQMINTARNYIYIATPYLIIDNTMIDALERAAKSGVDVRIICPKKWDKWYVHPVTQYHYKELLEAGVKIYEYTPGFIHSKIFLVDDRFATVGTVNMDYRSFFFHFECGVWMSGTESIESIKENLLETITKSEEIKLDTWVRRPYLLRIRQFLLHLFAPFM